MKLIPFFLVLSVYLHSYAGHAMPCHEIIKKVHTGFPLNYAEAKLISHDESSVQFLFRSLADNRALFEQKRALAFEDALIYRGTSLDESMPIEEIKSLFFKPNVLTTSDIHTKVIFKKTNRSYNNNIIFQKIEGNELELLRKSTVADYDELLSKPATIPSLLDEHQATSKNTPLVSFSEDRQIAANFARGTSALVITAKRPKFGLIDRNLLAKQRSISFRANSSGEKEILVFGALDPDAIEAIDYRTYPSGNIIHLYRNPLNPAEILQAEGSF